MTRDAKSFLQIVLLGAAVAGLAVGSLLHLLDAGSAGRWAWAGITTVVLVATIVSVVRGLL